MNNSDHSSIISGYKFDITNGAVTGEERVFGDHTFSLRIPSDATFTTGTGTVTETISGSRATETLQFTADSSDATLYHLSSETRTITSPTTTYGDHTFGYGFIISSGAVTAMSVTEGHDSHTHTETLRISPTATFTVGTDGSVTETQVSGHTLESTTYTPSGTAGLYAVSAETETFIQSGGSATRLNVEAFERAKFTVDTSGAVTEVDRVMLDGSTKTVTPDSSTTYSQLAAGYVLETHTHGTYSSYEVFHDGNGDGVYTAVAHGSGTTVDLVGLQAQISTGVNAVL